MKAIVFGGAGFLGSHVAEALSQAGHAVVIFDTKPSPFLRPDQEGIVCDILNQDQVTAAIKGCDVVYNFAGIADIEEANTRPLDTVRINILGNTILLEAAMQEKVRRFVFASSLYIYSEAGAFYRSSKQACELLIDNYRQAYGLPTFGEPSALYQVFLQRSGVVQIGLDPRKADAVPSTKGTLGGSLA